MNPVRYSPLRILRTSQRSSPRETATPSHIHVRYFHPTRSTPSPISAALDASTSLIHGVHDVTCLPWVISIPLTALLVRTLVGLPIQYYTRVHARRERDIAPLLYSWKVAMEKEGRREGKTTKQITQMLNLRGKALREKWNVNPWVKGASLLQIPVWISLMEGIRGMCGNTSGLVPWLLSLFRPNKESADEAIQSLNLTIEPTLANEGALWFPDLLVGDPTGALPALLTASILLNVNMGWKAVSFKEMAEMPKLQMYQNFFFSGLRMFIQVLAVNVGLSGWFYEMPAALMIYWIASSNIATLQTWLLSKYMYLRPSIPAYKATHMKFIQAGDPFKMNLK
ncbi:hypothetical protein N7493_009573 [Penicillium malachiteum]|uniref:Membrane insertase YidC/Oxa/ALB C-terminal domain-containing protein n=1 Tax=Penicillium malachiteum TaxID=1324776 RepID=A0AAD6HEG3_9EURO|nr:hypothetical protein N7493_009573 [Penicillium malachiteum]